MGREGRPHAGHDHTGERRASGEQGCVCVCVCARMERQRHQARPREPRDGAHTRYTQNTQGAAAPTYNVYFMCSSTSITAARFPHR